MNNEENNFIRLTPFKMQVLQNFPFIDADFDALTNYELLCKVVEYLNLTMEDVNILRDEIIGFEEYFDNLDVQEEINNKLDEMAENGELTEIIKSYVDPLYQSYTDNINAEIDSMNNSITNINNKVDASVGITPIPVTSVDDMTDETKIYVLTTNGYWYYYDSEWTQGGLYQSAGINENSIVPEYTTFYNNFNLIPKFNWVEGQVYANNGTLTTNNSGCYNAEYVSVDPTKKLYLIANDKFSSNYIKMIQYNSSKNVLTYSDISYAARSFQLNASCAYVRFAFYSNKFTTRPDNLFMLVSEDEYYKLNSYNIASKLKDDYNDKEISSDVLINHNVRYSNYVYKYGLTLTNSNVKFNNVNDVEFTGTATTSIVYVGAYLHFDDIQLNDVVYVDTSGTNKTITAVRLIRDGDIKVIELNKIAPSLYAGTVTNDILTYKEQLRAFVRFDDITNGDSVKVRIKTTLNNKSNTLEDYIDKNDSFKKFILLGDSITHMTGTSNWFLYLQEKMNASLIANVSVDGAHLKDYSDTGAYDGDPQNGNHNNVLGNQVQKIINNNYSAPDYIVIAIGTNGGINTTSAGIKDTYYDENETLIDVDEVDRQTDAGAFRWCNEKLHDTYPNAKIIWCTPIQGTLRSTHAIIEWGENLKELCSWGSNYCIDTEKCGISITNATEYLADGLHPNASGAKLMGNYNASEIRKIL